MGRKRRNRQGNNHGTNLVTRGSTATSKAVNVTKMDVSCVAKQLKQIKTTAQTTVVGILFDKQHETLCIADNMSKNMAVACIEESLTSASKNAQPSLDFNSHKLKDKALARVSLLWDTPKEAAVGLHRELATELKRESYGDLHHGSSPNDHNFHEMEIHSTGEKLTAADVQQLFVMSDSRSPCTAPAAASRTMMRMRMTMTALILMKMTKKNSKNMNMKKTSNQVLAEPATMKTRP